MSKSSELGVIIKAETSETLEKIKVKTGLSKSMIANIALAHISRGILAGVYQIVNGKIVATGDR